MSLIVSGRVLFDAYVDLNLYQIEEEFMKRMWNEEGLS